MAAATSASGLATTEESVCKKVSVHRVVRTAAAHAWNADMTAVAVADGSENVWIYDRIRDTEAGKGAPGAFQSLKDTKSWRLAHKLEAHTQRVTGLDWCPITNRLLTCSMDRNAYVWTKVDTKSVVWAKGEKGQGIAYTWKPTMVELNLKRAATVCRWSPTGKTFAVGGGEGVVQVCHYDESGDWWVPACIDGFRSAVLSLAYHPSGHSLAISSADSRVRVSSCFLVEAEGEGTEQDGGAYLPAEFAATYEDFKDGRSWAHAVGFSPDGASLAWVTHDASVCIAALGSGDGKSPVHQLRHRGLPFTTLQFVGSDALVCAGFSSGPVLFKQRGGKGWEEVGCIDGGRAAKKKKAGGKGGSFAANRQMFAAAVDLGMKVGADGAAKGGAGEAEGPALRHESAVVELRSVPGGVSSAGADGRVVLWKI